MQLDSRCIYGRGAKVALSSDQFKAGCQLFSVPGGLGGSCGRCNCGRASAVRDIGKPVGFVLGYA